MTFRSRLLFSLVLMTCLFMSSATWSASSLPSKSIGFRVSKKRPLLTNSVISRSIPHLTGKLSRSPIHGFSDGRLLQMPKNDALFVGGLASLSLIEKPMRKIEMRSSASFCSMTNSLFKTIKTRKSLTAVGYRHGKRFMMSGWIAELTVGFTADNTVNEWNLEVEAPEAPVWRSDCVYCNQPRWYWLMEGIQFIYQEEFICPHASSQGIQSLPMGQLAGWTYTYWDVSSQTIFNWMKGDGAFLSWCDCTRNGDIKAAITVQLTPGSVPDCPNGHNFTAEEPMEMTVMTDTDFFGMMPCTPFHQTLHTPLDFQGNVYPGGW